MPSPACCSLDCDARQKQRVTGLSTACHVTRARNVATRRRRNRIAIVSAHKHARDAESRREVECSVEIALCARRECGGAQLRAPQNRPSRHGPSRAHLRSSALSKERDGAIVWPWGRFAAIARRERRAMLLLLHSRLGLWARAPVRVCPTARCSAGNAAHAHLSYLESERHACRLHQLRREGARNRLPVEFR